MSDAVQTDIGPFAIVPDWIIRASISDRAVRVFAILARYADRDTLSAYPKRGTLAAACGCSLDSIDRALRELVALDSVTIEHRLDDAGDRTSSLYHLRFAPPMGSAVAAAVRPRSRTVAATGGRAPAAGVAAPVRQGTITSGTTPLETKNDLQAAWNELTTAPIPKALEMNGGRRRNAEARLRERGVHVMRDVFRKINDTPFCRGENDRGWRATIDWALKPANITKVLEGNYGTKRPVPVGRTGAPAPGKYAALASPLPALEVAS